MTKGFWKKLKKPFFALAPMYDVTDAPFRNIIAKYSKSKGAPDYVTFTEFVSADGLCSAQGKIKLLKHLKFSSEEHPIVAQIFGSNPDNIRKSASFIAKLGFDGVDINMGCPDKAVVRQGAGAGLMKSPGLAQEIIAAAKDGAGKIPVSVKTRIGFNKIETEKWIGNLLEAKPAAITIHCRTKKEMSLAPARWEEIGKAVGLANEMKEEDRPLIIGNGDVKNIKEAKIAAKKYGADGIMIGRGVFGKPWLFSGNDDPTTEEKIKILTEHMKLFEKIFKSDKQDKLKNFGVMRKHFKAYVIGFKRAKDLRIKLMEAKDAKNAEMIIKCCFQSL